MKQEAYIVSAQRTAVGKYRKGFATTRPDDLLATLLKHLVASHSRLDLAAIDDVIIGCAMPEAEQGLNVARIATLLADYPDSVPAMTINRFCASSLEAIAIAAQRIQLGDAHLIVAGGVESMSMIPMMGHKPTFNPKIFDDKHIAIAYGMGLTAENVARRYRIRRERQDAFALSSHQKALQARQKGAFRDEIMPYKTHTPVIDNDSYRITSNTIDQDEGPREDTSLSALAGLKPSFHQHGTVTAGNSSQVSDGAGALLLCSEKALKTYALEPIARFVGYTVVGVPPEIMGIGPIPAIPKALHLCQLKLKDIEWIELNEAFAAQSLAVIDELKLDEHIVNPRGGAIALGHPLGATGAIRTTTMLHAMRQEKKRYGMTTMCIGTGMGAAGIFQAL